ncbi:MAG TPA: hypothetical protein VIA18_31520, partial [Polyangia bacterium]|nr:hypothetical protein [Polyangia bacterium]
MVRGLVGTLALVLCATPARADMPSRLSVTGASECPTATALAHELTQLHPALRVDAEAELHVEVIDRGGRYAVLVGEHLRELDDPRRRCSERAAAAALAVTLILDPPILPTATTAAPAESVAEPPRATPPNAPTPRATAPNLPPNAKLARASDAETPRGLRPTATAGATAPSRPPQPRARRLSRLDLEITGVVDGAPALGGAKAEVTGGGALRFVLGGRNVAAALGVAGLAPTTFAVSSLTVRVVRVPFDADLRLAVQLEGMELAIDVGLALAILQLSATPVITPATSTRLDVGARVAPQLRIPIVRRVALVIGGQIVVSFAPYDLL